MKAEFSIEQIAEIAKHLRIYKKLVVTTRGQMFKKKTDAEEAVRTLNMVLDDTNDHVGILEMESNMVSDDKLKAFAGNTKLFDALFEKSKIPTDKDNKKKPHERKREERKAISDEVTNSVEAALNLKKEDKAEDKAEDKTNENANKK